MSVLTLLEKFYNPRNNIAKLSLQKRLSSVTSGLAASFNILGKNCRGWIQVEISGEDSPVLKNYIKKRIGIAPTQLEEVHVSTKVRGKIIDSGRVGYGIYIDLGIFLPKTIDALIPLHKLRKQLEGGKAVSLRHIINDFCLYDNFPLEIMVTRIDLDRQEIEAELSEEQVKTYIEWLALGLDRIIILGNTIGAVKRAIIKSGILRDIIKVAPLSILEHVLICKLGTDAPGIITKLGPYLPRVSLRAFSPRKILRRIQYFGNHF